MIINSFQKKINRTPLHESLRYSSSEISKLLIMQPQIDYNACDQEGILFIFF